MDEGFFRFFATLRMTREVTAIRMTIKEERQL